MHEYLTESWRHSVRIYLRAKLDSNHENNDADVLQSEQARHKLNKFRFISWRLLLGNCELNWT